MSNSKRSGLPFGCRALQAGVLAWLVACPILAQAPPDQGSNALDTSKRRSEVATQKAEADIRLAVRTAQNLSTTDPGKALERFKDALTLVEDSRTLSDERKSALRSMLKDRIRVTELAVAAPKDSGDVDKKIRKATQKAEDEKLAAEKDQIRRLLDGIQGLQKEGKLGQAKLLAGDLASRFPSTPAATAADKIASASGQLADNRELKLARERSAGGALRQVEQSAVPPNGDIQFPKDWKERTKNRGNLRQTLTTKEQAIIRGLNSVISPTFKDSHLEDVIEYLQTYIGQPIVLDPQALDAAGVKYDTPVTVKAKAVTVRTVLKMVLRDLGLTYVIKDELIQVTTPDKAKDMMIVKVYPIADLARNRLEAAMLIDLIQTTIEPESWRANGGTGTIVYNPLTRSIVIKQTAEFHSALGSILP